MDYALLGAVKFTSHALDQMRDRFVTRSDILWVLSNHDSEMGEVRVVTAHPAVHDPEADAVWIRLRDGIYDQTVELDDRRLLDVAADGTALRVELLDVSDGVHLDGIPQAAEIADALRRCGIKVLHPTT